MVKVPQRGLRPLRASQRVSRGATPTIDRAARLTVTATSDRMAGAALNVAASLCLYVVAQRA